MTDFALNFSARNYTNFGRCFLFVFTAARHHSRGRVSSSAVPGELHLDARGPAPSRDIESLIVVDGGNHVGRGGASRVRPPAPPRPSSISNAL